MSLQPCHPSFPQRTTNPRDFALSCTEPRIVVPPRAAQKFPSLCSVSVPLLVRKAEPVMLPWGSCRCCGTLQVGSLVMFESQSALVWLAAAGTPGNHLLSIDLPWLKRQKLNIRSENAVSIDVLAHELFTSPWRPRKYYTVPFKPNNKWNFCFCSWCSLYSFHPASSWEYFSAKKNLLCSAKKASIWQYLWNFRKVIPKESPRGHNMVQIAATLMLKLFWFNFKAAPPWGPLSSGKSNVSVLYESLDYF